MIYIFDKQEKGVQHLPEKSWTLPWSVNMLKISGAFVQHSSFYQPQNTSEGEYGKCPQMGLCAEGKWGGGREKQVATQSQISSRYGQGWCLDTTLIMSTTSLKLCINLSFNPLTMSQLKHPNSSHLPFSTLPKPGALVNFTLSTTLQLMIDSLDPSKQNFQSKKQRKADCVTFNKIEEASKKTW